MNSLRLLFVLVVSLFIPETLLIAQQAEEINILFIGNSFTARHDLIELVKEVCEEGRPGLE